MITNLSDLTERLRAITNFGESNYKRVQRYLNDQPEHGKFLKLEGDKIAIYKWSHSPMGNFSSDVFRFKYNPTIWNKLQDEVFLQNFIQQHIADFRRGTCEEIERFQETRDRLGSRVGKRYATSEDLNEINY